MTRSLPYQLDNTTFDGVYVGDDKGYAPTILVFHGMEGRSEAQVEFAHRLTTWGYQAIAVDLFGTAVSAAGPDACAAEMAQFVKDRSALRQRLDGVVATLRERPGVDQVAAIGFCFGGLCVLDLARSRNDLRAVASFHGLLTAPDVLSVNDITAKIAVFHGWDDPYAPPQDVVALGRELTTRRADWQLHAYGNAMHAFMAPMANAPERGIQYDELTARRAWQTLGVFLDEVFTESR